MAGDAIALLVLAPGYRSCVGVDLDSGAMVRAHHPPRQRGLLRPFVVAEGVVRDPRFDRPEQPESVDLAGALQPIGHLRGWRADRYLRPLLHPKHRPILDLQGPSIHWWQLEGDRPSVALVAPESEPVVHVDGRGVRVRFAWNGSTQDLPLEDPRVLSRLDWTPPSPLRGPQLLDLLGFVPERLVVAMSRPIQGLCHKVVAGLLPRH